MPADQGQREHFGFAEFEAKLSALDPNVSRETFSSLRRYGDLLEEESQKHNLVSQGSLAFMWLRHFWDSAQLLPLIPPDAKTIADLGSGAGFPGLVLATLLRERPGLKMHLFEATQKKARFLKFVAENLGLPVDVRAERIEDAGKQKFDAMTVRALAPLDRLLPYAQRFWGPKTVGLFLKGQSVELELTEANKSWRMEVSRHPSLSDPSGVILEVRELSRVHPERPTDRGSERSK